MNEIFYLCVRILQILAHRLGMTYEEVNVWIFCIIWPAITVLLFALVFIFTWLGATRRIIWNKNR